MEKGGAAVRRAAISASGWIAPVSWLAAITETMSHLLFLSKRCNPQAFGGGGNGLHRRAPAGISSAQARTQDLDR